MIYDAYIEIERKSEERAWYNKYARRYFRAIDKGDNYEIVSLIYANTFYVNENDTSMIGKLVPKHRCRLVHDFREEGGKL